MSIYTPAIIADTLMTIPLQELKERGIVGMAFDLDNTIVEWNAMNVAEDVQVWFREIKAAGFLPIIVSNNSAERIRPVAELLDIPFVPRAQKPRAIGALKAMEQLGLTPQSCALVGDQIMTDMCAGNRAGFLTVLVTPISPHEFWGTKINRRIEKIFYRRMRRPHRFRQ